MSNARKLADNLPTEGSLSGRNLIINGKFEIDQRHGFAAHTVSSGGDFFADRWGFYTDSNAFAQYGATTQVVSDSPTGFEKSLKWTTTSAGTVPATSEVIFRHVVEGYNINQVDYGTSNAKELTLSFYVKSSVAGNYGLTAQYTDSGGTNRYNLRSYTINSANTWELKTILIPANTANVLQQKTNGAGLRLNWDLGEGTSYSGSVTGNWQTTYVNGLTGGVKIANNNGATWQITGVQLEVGPQSTSFEHEPVGVTLSKCKRYYQTYGGNDAYEHLPFYGLGNGTVANFNYGLPVEMRSAPSVSSVSGWVVQGPYGASTYTVGSFALANTTTKVVRGDIQGISSSIGNNTVRLFALNSTNARFNLDAEL